MTQNIKKTFDEKRIRVGDNGMPRGEELRQVLELAAQFPARELPRELPYPPFGKKPS